MRKVLMEKSVTYYDVLPYVTFHLHTIELLTFWGKSTLSPYVYPRSEALKGQSGVGCRFKKMIIPCSRG